MLTWAIAWMSVQMVRAGKELAGLSELLFCSIIMDGLLLAFGGWVIFK